MGTPVPEIVVDSKSLQQVRPPLMLPRSVLLLIFQAIGQLVELYKSVCKDWNRHLNSEEWIHLQHIRKTFKPFRSDTHSLNEKSDDADGNSEEEWSLCPRTRREWYPRDTSQKKHFILFLCQRGCHPPLTCSVLFA